MLLLQVRLYNSKPENFKVYITGIKDNQQVIFGDDTSTYRALIVEKDGVYDVNWEDNHHSYGIWCNFLGDCNITITQLPTSILKDLSGNGNHAYLYGGKGKLNSGMGLYKVDYTTYNNNGNQNVTDIKPNSFVLLAGALSRLGLPYSSIIGEYIPSYAIRIQGISGGTITYYYRNENGKQLTYVMDADGDYILPPCYSEGTEGTAVNIVSNNNINNVTITQIPDYPNQLCYDGKMYAVCYGFPILTDYTVMADRTWFIEQLSNWTGVLSSNAYSGYTEERGFIFEYNAETDKVQNNSFGANNLNTRHQDGISYMTKTSYNGNSINSGDLKGVDFLTIGAFVDKDTLKGSYNWKGCHGKIIIADRSFTEDEITWLKDNFFTIDIPTPAYDFDFSKLKSGENTFTDKYGNELSLHNFAWSGMSGKGGYVEDFTTWRKQASSTIENLTPCSVRVTNPVNANAFLYLSSTSVNAMRIEVKGNFNGNSLRYQYYKDGSLNNITIDKPGIYDLPSSEAVRTTGFYNQTIAGDYDITITQLPLYPNALVFDGIDDYCKLSKMTIKTVILDFVNLELNRQIYDNRDKPNNHYNFSIYPEADTIAYEARNSDGKTYIDGELNTTIKTNDLLEVRCIVCASNNSAKETEQYISKDSLLNNFYGKMALYRITGFTEVLTPDQVWKWYQKNKLKGGDK